MPSSICNVKCDSSSSTALLEVNIKRDIPKSLPSHGNQCPIYCATVSGLGIISSLHSLLMIVEILPHQRTTANFITYISHQRLTRQIFNVKCTHFMDTIKTSSFCPHIQRCTTDNVTSSKQGANMHDDR